MFSNLSNVNCWQWCDNLYFQYFADTDSNTLDFSLKYNPIIDTLHHQYHHPLHNTNSMLSNWPFEDKLKSIRHTSYIGFRLSIPNVLNWNGWMEVCGPIGVWLERFLPVHSIVLIPSYMFRWWIRDWEMSWCDKYCHHTMEQSSHVLQCWQFVPMDWLVVWTFFWLTGWLDEPNVWFRC